MPSTDTITRDTTLCISLAARPSNIGTRFHNFRVFRHECGSAEGLRWAGDVGRQRCWIGLPGC